MQSRDLAYTKFHRAFSNRGTSPISTSLLILVKRKPLELTGVNLGMAAMTLVTTVERQDTGVQCVGWNRVVMIGGNFRVDRSRNHVTVTTIDEKVRGYTRVNYTIRVYG